MPYKVLSDEVLNETFGNPLFYVQPDGTINPRYENLYLTNIPLPFPLVACWNKNQPISHVKCNRKIAKRLHSALYNAMNDVEVASTIGDYGGCFNFRLQRKSSSMLSRHSWGIAIDLDCADNPFGHNPNVHPRLIEYFETEGFTWGGYFPKARRDGMHFEFADLTKL